MRNSQSSRGTPNRKRSPKPAYDRGLDLLARRPHFAAELAAKLEQRGYGAAEVESAVERLTVAGHLNEEETAHVLVRSLKRRGYGRRRLELDLRRRGADETAARTALEPVDDEDELERAAAVAARFRSSHPSRDAAALARHLERRGFLPRTIGTVVFDTAGGGIAEGEMQGESSC
ncbi:MAG: regulatory protein RecX [Holophagales bacterium]|nr:regulatory protein RecX [Holophagales bacterium]MXX60282.1 regulatory protein RecX [Holophagales bacterium]MYC08902.1 regulatory protein RecX [Holophagales bacterium]MYD20869.1 regulatory protein RecX [Holophagales bacterium]MYI33761.1 regulatory protein RecX [Holophagales bacterium]